MINRHDVDVSTRGIQKIVYKFISERKYEDRKRVGRPPKLSKRSHNIIRRLCLKNILMLLTNISLKSERKYVGLMKITMEKRRPNNLVDLKYNLPQTYIVDLFRSMPRRTELCVERAGDITKY